MKLKEICDGVGKNKVQNKLMENIAKYGYSPHTFAKVSLSTGFSIDEIVDTIYEAAPPCKDAEEFIKKNKKKFRKRYGNRWKQVLYATAWKIFGEKCKKRRKS